MRDAKKFAAIILLSIAIFSPAANCAADSAISISTDPHYKWLLPRDETPKAAVICINGLNTNPEIFDPIVEVLLANNFAVLRIGLAGHLPGESLSELGTADNWLTQVANARTFAKAQFPNLPLYGAGYSLGALVLVRYADLNPEASFDRMFLIAPALSLTWTSAAVRLITPLRVLGISLPSLTPENFRAHNWTPLRTYYQLTSLVDDVQQLNYPAKLSGISTILALNKTDLLVSATGVRKWTEKNKLDHWGILYLEPSADAENFRGHLLVNENGLGVATWGALTQKLLEHFK